MLHGTHVYLQFHGAADGVTGSLHRLHVQGRDILLDCGLYQGRRAEANAINRDLPAWAARAHATVLSHAHIDHSGNLPTLVKRGFKGNIYCSAPTRDLCSVMLRDSAMLQEQDARYLNRKLRREGSRDQIEPLYTVADAQNVLKKTIGIPLDVSMPVAPGVTMTLHEAGHVLGSSLVRLDLEENGRRVRLLFTGDLGREELPLLDRPAWVDKVDVLVMESTYGDRTHPDIQGMDDQLLQVVSETIDRGGRVYIPTFALERAQEVLFALERLHERGALPRVPIYIDSPLAIAITEIYKLHADSLAEDVRARLLSRNDPFSPPGLQYISDVEASKGLQANPEPCIVIAGSGMCEGGRIVFHLARALQDRKNSVVIVGFMAQHTLGRRLLEGRRQVKVLGVERDVRARVHAISGLSAHADHEDLLAYATGLRARGNVHTVALVHGESGPRENLATSLREHGFGRVLTPTRGDQIEL